ncbi:MAG TPA: SH3 domain-containing protein [Chloroflexota bacterium]
MRKLVAVLIVLVSLEGAPAAAALAAPSHDTSTVSGGAIVQTALRYLGYAYTTVGNSPATGFSCIGFVSYVYQSNGIPLPDDLGGAMGYAAPISFADLQPGDILYFGNTVWPGLSHTAIYLGGGRFIHAEWYNRGVVISSFTNDPVDFNYWSAHYIGANRPWGVAAAPPVAPSTVQTSPVESGLTRTQAAISHVMPRALVAQRPALLAGPRESVDVSGLNIRVRPSLSGPIRRIAAHGTQLVVLKQYNNWDWVQLPDATFGWAMGTALGVRGETPSSSGMATYAQPLSSVRVNGLRVHVRPNVAAPVITTAYHGQHVIVLQGWNSWLRVLMPHGARGWVSGAYVDIGGGQATAAAPRHITRSHASRTRSWTAARRTRSGSPTITAGVRLHTRPNLGAPVLGLAVPGTHIKVLESWNGWIDARFQSGRTGWVYAAYVRR